MQIATARKKEAGTARQLVSTVLLAAALMAGTLGSAAAATDHLGRTSFSISSPGRRLEITTVCHGPNAVFTVRNLEKRANDLGHFTVLGGDGETVLVSRRLRLSAGQSIRFAIATARLEPFGGRAIFRVAMVAANPTTLDTDILCA